MPAGPPRPRRPGPWAALALLAGLAAGPASRPDALQPWVEQLAAADPADRAAAEAHLAAAGRRAVPALVAAGDDPRPDVADRARRTLRRVRLFTLRGVPDAALALADRYLSADAVAARAVVAAQLLELRPVPAAVVVRLVLLEPDAALRRQLLGGVGTGYRAAVPALVAEGDAAALGPLLEQAAAEVPGGGADYAVDQVLGGHGDDALARWRAELANAGPGRRAFAAGVLCDLSRAAGRTRDAADAARQSDDPRRVLLTALDAGDWAAAADAVPRCWPGPREPGLAAALAQLAGRPVGQPGSDPSDPDGPAKARLLLGQVDHGFALLVDDPATAFRLRRARGEYDDALALADRSPHVAELGPLRDDLRRLLGELPAPPREPAAQPAPLAADAWARAVRALSAHRYAAVAAGLADADPARVDCRYVRGYALAAGGDSAGAQLMRDAALAPLADVARRAWLADNLDAAGLSAEAAAQRALAARTANPFQQPAATLDLNVARLAAATAAHDAPTAVAAATRVWLLSFWPGLSWSDPLAYLTVPADLHLARARLARSRGDWPAVAAELAAHAELFPAAADVALEWVPAYDAHGDATAADALFAAAYDRLDAQSQRHPRSPYLHNQAAWLAACCCRRLDAATAHAAAAVQLVPGDWQYVDTLAECRFRGGDRPAAADFERQAAALPGVDAAYAARQLARFAAAPVPSTTRPADPPG